MGKTCIGLQNHPKSCQQTPSPANQVKPYWWSSFPPPVLTIVFGRINRMFRMLTYYPGECHQDRLLRWTERSHCIISDGPASQAMQLQCQSVTCNCAGMKASSSGQSATIANSSGNSGASVGGSSFSSSSASGMIDFCCELQTGSSVAECRIAAGCVDLAKSQAGHSTSLISSLSLYAGAFILAAYSWMVLSWVLGQSHK